MIDFKNDTAYLARRAAERAARAVAEREARATARAAAVTETPKPVVSVKPVAAKPVPKGWSAASRRGRRSFTNADLGRGRYRSQDADYLSQEG